MIDTSKEIIIRFLAKIHCVADSDCINLPKDVNRLPLSIIPQHTEKTIRDAIRGQDEEFINEMVEFGMVCLIEILCLLKIIFSKYSFI